MKKEKFVIYTLGCKLNFSESSDISRQLKEQGFFYSDDTPDIIIVNSCAVTATAVKKARNMVSGLHRQFPEASIIVMGCYTALEPEILHKWPGVNAVFGNEDKANIIPYLLDKACPIAPKFIPAFSSGDRTRSFLKIQDGCDYYCSYCTVARARGESRSDSIENILKQLCQISLLQMKEVILTGVNIGDFGRKNGESFLNLLKAIEERQIVERVRISSIEPNLLSDEIIDLVGNSKILMPHFHIPLQSGSNAVLLDMKRRYNRELFKEKVLKIKSIMPDACIAIDVISGFPSESDQDFEDSIHFIEGLPVSYLHVFTYSKRKNTPAGNMPQLKDSVKKERTIRLLRLSEEKKNRFYKQHLGEQRLVLFESDEHEGMMYGFTDNYLRVKLTYNLDWINRIVPVKLDANCFAPELQIISQ